MDVRRFQSAWERCPLCGMGEMCGAYLVLWCPAVAFAWKKLTGNSDRLAEHVRTPGPYAAFAARLLHQASFLACSYREHRANSWQYNAAWLVRACRSKLTYGDLADEEDMDDSEQPFSAAGALVEDSLARWDADNDSCGACGCMRGHCVRGS